MRQAFLLGRFISCRASKSAFSAAAIRQRCFSQLRPIRATVREKGRPSYNSRPLLLCAALSPAAFIELSEGDHASDKTGEEQMLEASRAEIQKHLPKDSRGVKRVVQTIAYLWDKYIYEPVATGFRFLHLVVIFVPVIVTVPAVWVGGRVKDRDNERRGTLWWYSFLVKSMERAGPAFIKVSMSCHYSVIRSS